MDENSVFLSIILLNSFILRKRTFNFVQKSTGMWTNIIFVKITFQHIMNTTRDIITFLLFQGITILCTVLFVLDEEKVGNPTYDGGFIPPKSKSSSILKNRNGFFWINILRMILLICFHRVQICLYLKYHCAQCYRQEPLL